MQNRINGHPVNGNDPGIVQVLVFNVCPYNVITFFKNVACKRETIFEPVRKIGVLIANCSIKLEQRYQQLIHIHCVGSVADAVGHAKKILPANDGKRAYMIGGYTVGKFIDIAEYFVFGKLVYFSVPAPNVYCGLGRTNKR